MFSQNVIKVQAYHIPINRFSLFRSGNGGNGGGSLLCYLQEQTGQGWITEQTQAWAGSQNKTRQAMDTMMSSVCNAIDGEQIHISQEALIQPVRDMGHSESLRGHFRGTQPFEKGLGFPHRVPELRGWDDMRLTGQVRTDVAGIEDTLKLKINRHNSCWSEAQGQSLT